MPRFCVVFRSLGSLINRLGSLANRFFFGKSKAPKMFSIFSGGGRLGVAYASLARLAVFRIMPVLVCVPFRSGLSRRFVHACSVVACRW